MLVFAIACVGVFGDRQGDVRKLHDMNVFVAIKSAPTHTGRRAELRQSPCFDEYHRHGMSYRFFVGVPLSPGHALMAHNQGGINTEEERRIEGALIREHERFTDIQAVPMRDTYMNLPNKLLHILTYGYHVSGAAYVAVHDDEYCLDPRAVRAMIDKHRHGAELYGGTYLWKGTEYKSMAGPAHMIAPYFSGWDMMLSRGLIWHLVRPELWMGNVMWGNYGTSADDCDMGKWVRRARERFNVTVTFVQQDLRISINR